MITDGKKWHDLAVKTLLALFRVIPSNNDGDLCVEYCFLLKLFSLIYNKN